MSDQFIRPAVAGTDGISFDSGLRAHMQRVFNYMAGGLAFTGIIAFVIANTALANIIYGSPLRFVAMIAPLALVIYMQVRMQRISVAQLRVLFWAFCGSMGLSMGAIFLVYSEASIARAFFISGATFAATSLWGYTTKRNLSGLGSFMLMGFFGLFIASIVNLFLHSAPLQWVTSVAGVVIFTGITAWQMQSIKQTYSAGWGSETNDKLAVYGALRLYISFINLFQSILSLTGGRR